MRLNSYLAKAGVASRRQADEFIKGGNVMVNGRAGRLNDDVTDRDEIRVNQKIIKLQQNRYILLFKPAGYVTTLKDPQNRPKILDLLSISERLVPVGRLDIDTTGAILLTNDGALAHELAHPSFEKDKVYEVETQEKVTPNALKKLASGVKLSDGVSAPAKARKLADNKIELTLHEGRNHQVKRMVAAVGLTVKKLHRSAFGPLQLGGMEPGEWRELSPAEVARLKG